MDKLTTYLKNVRGELAHVRWPSREEIISYTIVVVAISLIVAGILGLFDVLLREALITLS